jgi:hypothetical protein
LYKSTDTKLKSLLNKHDILNLEDLNYSFISKNNLLIVNDGNTYYIEAKVGNNFTFKEFDNPEMYLKIDKTKVYQAQVFNGFITELEKLILALAGVPKKS